MLLASICEPRSQGSISCAVQADASAWQVRGPAVLCARTNRFSQRRVCIISTAFFSTVQQRIGIFVSIYRECVSLAAALRYARHTIIRSSAR